METEIEKKEKSNIYARQLYELNKERYKEKRVLKQIKLSEKLLSENKGTECLCGMRFNSVYSMHGHRKTCNLWIAKPGNKICRTCKIEKEVFEFPKSSQSSDGLYMWCKTCTNIKHNQKVQNNKQKYVNKRKSRYQLNSERIANNRKNNTEKFKEKDKSWRENNQDKIKLKSKYYHEWNKNWIRVSQKLYRDKIINDVIDKLGDTCTSCNQTEREFLSIDHIKNDGKNDRNNKYHLQWKREIMDGGTFNNKLQILCHNCNAEKEILNNKSVFEKECGNECGNKICKVCNGVFNKKSFRGSKGSTCAKCLTSKERVENSKLKIELFGNKCMCCGEDNILKLTIDHVNNDGSLKRCADGAGLRILRKIKSNKIDKNEYQLLCWNCNYSKHVGEGICKHKREYSCILTKPSDVRHFAKLNLKNDEINFQIKDVKINIIRPSEAYELLAKLHYAGFGRASKIIFGGYLDEELICVAKFSPPIRVGVASSIELNIDQILELERMCIKSGYNKKNLASNFLSKVIKLIKKSPHQIKALVSFADPAFGHEGTIYKASNWKYLGLTQTSYHYRGPDGRINKKTVYNRAKKESLKESEYVKQQNLFKVFDPSKHKYVYELDRYRMKDSVQKKK